MKCPHCHSEVGEDSQFCSKCGTRVSSAGSGSSATRTIRTTTTLDTLVGTTLAGKYQIESEIGRGGMGVVYRAQDLKLKRPVALKFLPPDFASDPETRERFVVEAQAAAALSHPNICTIYEVGEAEELSYIAMEFVEGQSLRQKIKIGPLKPEEATDIAAQVAGGLAEAHKKGIIHRDVKAANIMVTPQGQAKVMDFGLAKLRGGSSLTKTQTTLGTVAYMSPEQARGKTLDSRTDIWSLGVVLYEMLTGKLPFRGDHDQAVIHAIAHEEPEPLRKEKSSLTAEFENVVGQALAKKPADRYQTMDEFREDLEAVAEGLKPLRAKRRRVPQRILGIRKTHAYPALAGLLVTGVLAALFVFPKRGQALDSIAVLPFENVSADPNMDYLCDGIAETIINKLSQLSGFKTVINRSSAFSFKGKAVDPRKVGRELGVKAILLTRLSRTGDRLTVSPTLVRASDGGQIWGQRYERGSGDALALEENITASVVQALRLNLTEEDKRAMSAREINNSAAYEFYLKARQEIDKFREDSLDRAVQFLQSGLDQVGDNALLYATLGYAHFGYVNLGIRMEENSAKAVEYAQRALALDPSSSKAYTVLGLVKSFQNLKESVRYFKKALALDPNETEALTWLASFYGQAMGKTPEAFRLLERAARVDPLNLFVNSNQGGAYFNEGRYDLAVDAIGKAYRLDPGNAGFAGGYAMALIYAHKIDEASAVIDRMVQAFKDNAFTIQALAWKYAALNDRTNLLKLLTPEFRQTEMNMSAAWMASALAAVGEKEKAMDWLEQAVDTGYLGYPMMAKTDPWLAGIRGEPRFKKLLERVKYEWDHFED